MLRAIGMTRRQVRRMIRYESVITALIGAVLGIILGIVLAGLLVWRVDFIDFSVPGRAAHHLRDRRDHRRDHRRHLPRAARRPAQPAASAPVRVGAEGRPAGDPRRAQRPARPQAPRCPDGAGDHPRRRDGERHLRPHRHDRQGVLLDLRRLLRGHRRRRLRQGRRTSASRASTRSHRRSTSRCVDDVSALPERRSRLGQRRGRDEHEDHRLRRQGHRTRRARRASASGSRWAREVDRFNPLKLVEGAWADADGEVVIDAGTADREGYAVGDTIRSRPAAVQDFKITGIAKFGESTRSAARHSPIFDLPTAQRLLDREGKLDAISVAGKEGTTRRS